MLSLSASHPTVSATVVAPVTILAHRAQHLVVDALDQVVAALIELVDAALGGRDLVIVAGACLVLLVPELDVRARELGDERTDRFRWHFHRLRSRARGQCREERES